MPVKCVRAFDEREDFVCVDFTPEFGSVISHKMTGKLKLGSRPNLLHPCLSLSVKQGYLCPEPFAIAVLPPAVF